MRQSLLRILGALGLSCREAESGEHALELLEVHGEAALIVSDVQMPGMDGIAFLREVRRRYADTAVIMLTGMTDVTSAVESLRQGAVDYLSKPVLVEELRARAQQALDRRGLIIENRFLQQSYQERLEAQVRELDMRGREQFVGQIQMAVRMLEKKDVYTRGHSSRVAAYAVKTAAKMGYTGTMLDEFQLGGELHDIGKIGTRDAVLNKPGPLDPEEFEEIKQHTVAGEEILEPIRREHPIVLQIVRWHHERLDGSGFPDGLVGRRDPRGGAHRLRGRCLRRHDHHPGLPGVPHPRPRPPGALFLGRSAVRSPGGRGLSGGPSGARPASRLTPADLPVSFPRCPTP